MSPVKLQEFREREKMYGSFKHTMMANLVRLMLVAKLGLYIRDEGRKIQKKKLRQIKISLLCMEFVKIIKNKFRLKITEKARVRMTNLHYFHHIPALVSEGCQKRARNVLLESLALYMEFRGLQELCANSEAYLAGVKFIQHFFRKRAFLYLQRIEILC
jgi:hypothetical protein